MILKILVVDDDELIKEITQEVLERAGHTVITAGGVYEASMLLQDKGPFDVLCTDRRMPGATGDDLIMHVRTFFPDTATCLVSGSLSSDDDKAADVVVHKPWDVAQLCAAVLQAFATRKQKRGSSL